MMRATVSLTPSTVRSPVLHSMVASLVQLELMMVFPDGPGFDQPEATTYQSGSPEASTNFSLPIVRQGKRPTAGRVQLGVIVRPWKPVMLVIPLGTSGQRKAPGLSSPLIAACCAT